METELSPAEILNWCELIHKLKSPLTVIKGYTELLLNDRGLFSESQKSEFLGKISTQTTNLQDLIDSDLEKWGA
jgi:signal transduction histidine kinase